MSALDKATTLRAVADAIERGEEIHFVGAWTGDSQFICLVAANDMTAVAGVLQHRVLKLFYKDA